MKGNSNQQNSSMHHGAPQSSFLKAMGLRRNMTEAEVILWGELKSKKFKGLKFRRQHPVQLFIVDFYCHALKLVIEIDGEYHNSKEQKEKDEERTKVLEELELKVIRFSNNEILNDLAGILKELEDFINHNC